MQIAQRCLSGALRSVIGRLKPAKTRFSVLRVFGVVVSLIVAGVILLHAASQDKFIEALQAFRRVSPFILLAFPLYVSWNLLATFAWRTVLCALRPKTVGGVRLMLISRLSAQSFNVLVPTGGLGGEVLRSAALTRLGVSLSLAGTTTLIDNITGVVGGLVFAVVVILIESSRYPSVRTTTLVIFGVSVGILGTLFFLPRWTRWGVARYRRTHLNDSIVRPLVVINSRRFAKAFLAAVSLRVTERLLMAVEVWLCFFALGTTIRPLDACLIVAALVLTGFVFFLIPAQLGAAEGAIVVASGLFGVAPELALSVALLRRSRQVLTSLVGLLFLPWVTPGAQPKNYVIAH